MRTVAPAAAVALMVALLVGVAQPAEAAPGDPAVTVTPSTDLLDNQLVTVAGTGFNPDATAFISMCLPDAVDSLGCDARQYLSVPIDGNGSFIGEYHVIRFAQSFQGGPASRVDCALVACTVGAADLLIGASNAVRIPVEFRDTGPVLPLPPATVSPDTDLPDGQRVTMSATGLRPFEPTTVRQCGPGAINAADCSGPQTTASADASGELSVELATDRVLFASGSYLDCATVACTIGIDSIAGFQQLPIDFADPTLSIDVTDRATLKAGTDDVVAQATISCDVATPVTVYTSITQPGVDYRYRLLDQRCAPGEPLVAFLPSRLLFENANPFALGPATVSVSARPLRSLNLNHPATVSAERAESVELLDFDTVKAFVDAALADPANTEIRAEVLQALRLRVGQDPVFRAEFFAAIFGGA